LNTPSYSPDFPPLLAACDFELYQRNIFRVTGLPVEATQREISRQAQKLQMMAEMGASSAPLPNAFSLSTPVSADQIREALARAKEPELRLIDEFFWFWPETAGEALADPALLAIQKGDRETAIQLWKERETYRSIPARHNLAVMHHLAAIDGSTRNLSATPSPADDNTLKFHWQEAASRWQMLEDHDEVWAILKQRIIALEDEAITYSVVRRFRYSLPVALAGLHAEAAFRSASRGDEPWTTFHKNLMGQSQVKSDEVEAIFARLLDPTRKRIEQDLAEVMKSPDHTTAGVRISLELLSRCQPQMELYDLLLGSESHHRVDLFDSVASAVNQIMVAYHQKTQDHANLREVLEEAMDFAKGSVIIERLRSNIAIAENNLSRARWSGVYHLLEAIFASKADSAEKIKRITKEILEPLAQTPQHETSTPGFKTLLDTIATAFREIAITSKNYTTALKAIHLAYRFVSDPESRIKFKHNLLMIEEGAGIATCGYCGNCKGEAKRKMIIPMYQMIDRTAQGLRFNTREIIIPRCSSCFADHQKHWHMMWVGSALGFLLGGFAAPWSATAGLAVSAILILIFLSTLNDDSPRSVTCGALMGLMAATVCIGLAGSEVTKIVFVNMVGGAIPCGAITWLFAKKLIYKQTPKAFALQTPMAISMTKAGWKQGVKPSNILN